jgi:hypothetical protein
MPMAAELGQRYAALFKAYGIGGNLDLLKLKGRIALQEEQLREDAMYFLLVNLDHMVRCPLAAYIPGDEMPIGSPMPDYVSHDAAQEMVNRCLDIILEDLPNHRIGAARASANAVIRAINANSQKIGEVVAWWREPD